MPYLARLDEVSRTYPGTPTPLPSRALQLQAQKDKQEIERVKKALAEATTERTAISSKFNEVDDQVRLVGPPGNASSVWMVPRIQTHQLPSPPTATCARPFSPTTPNMPPVQSPSITYVPPLPHLSPSPTYPSPTSL